MYSIIGIIKNLFWVRNKETHSFEFQNMNLFIQIYN